jgi:hypothetical protein
MTPSLMLMTLRGIAGATHGSLSCLGFSCVGFIVFALPTLCITPFKCAQLSGRYRAKPSLTS